MLSSEVNKVISTTSSDRLNSAQEVVDIRENVVRTSALESAIWEWEFSRPFYSLTLFLEVHAYNKPEINHLCLKDLLFKEASPLI